MIFQAKNTDIRLDTKIFINGVYVYNLWVLHMHSRIELDTINNIPDKYRCSFIAG